MGGSINYDPGSGPLGENAAPVLVAWYDGVGTFTPLWNVVCDTITHRDGSEPSVARFHYLLDIMAQAQGYPSQFEDLWPLDAQGLGVVQPDDRICVLAWTPAGDRRILFDGFAQIPQTDLTPTSQSVTFVAVSVAARCFDTIVGGRVQRPANNPTIDGNFIQTDLPTRFNPLISEGVAEPNSTAAGYDEFQGDDFQAHPIFLDEKLKRTPDPRAAWTLSGAVRYLLFTYNQAGKYVDNPVFANLDAMLQTRTPTGSGTADPNDPTTYTARDIVVRDYDATGKPWPKAVAELLAYAGFGFRFRLRADGSGLPLTELVLYRLDDASAIGAKELQLQAGGANIAAGSNTVAQLHLARDLNAVVNAFSIETPPRRVECSVVLALGFTPAAGDEVAPARDAFLLANLGDAGTTTKNKYRLFLADETGEGHWDLTSAYWTTKALDFSAVFPSFDNGDASYVQRVRPGSRHIVTRDANNKRRPAALYFSRDYAGKCPAVWDGTGTWQPIAPGHGWRLLDDRLGIILTDSALEEWNIGKSTGATAHEKSVILKTITSLANPSGGNTKFYLRLTTAIDDDIMLGAVVGARVSSPTKFERRRRVDARDHYLIEAIHKSSAYYLAAQSGQGNADPGNPDQWLYRDDTDKALVHARQLRAAHEMPPLAGSVTIPWLCNAYEVGDRLRFIRGRNVSLRTNAGDSSEGPRYPHVVEVTWSFAGEEQSTTLQFTDFRGEPARA